MKADDIFEGGEYEWRFKKPLRISKMPMALFLSILHEGLKIQYVKRGGHPYLTALTGSKMQIENIVRDIGTMLHKTPTEIERHIQERMWKDES